ncbi:hypothetical protein RDWZM_005621 [Blomia tropicalis]|uniref:Protein kinase domain-containing protein n=1 Tax=Blomia tropicalis TaxID=40697 RepID=A0A9Q0M6J6_BLOTA|nr:hypothetical protein RDWZM_005621 [Blomia tropicalis]
MDISKSSSSNCVVETFPEMAQSVRDYLYKRKYSVVDFIRRGSTSMVYKLLDQKGERFLAVKVMDHSKLSEFFRTRMLQNEMSIIRAIHHPNIVCVENTFEVPGYSVIVTEYADEGDLMCHVEMVSQPNVPLARRWFVQIARALSYLHKQGIAHRDIKVDNILLCSGTAKLSDFGYALRSVDANGEVVFTTDMCGTLEYQAPEALVNQPYNPFISDCFSMGVLLYVLVTHLFPFGSFGDTPSMTDRRDMLAAILAKKWPKGGAIDQDSRLYCLLCQLLNPNTNERITINQALAHPWTF